jgi:HEAT repeat protein
MSQYLALPQKRLQWAALAPHVPYLTAVGGLAMNKLLVAGLGILLTLSWSARAAGDEPSAVAKLVEKLREPDVNVRPKTAALLGAFGSAAKDAVPMLGKMLRQDNSHKPSLAAAKALAKIGAPAVPELIESLKHPVVHIRYRAAWALGQIGPDAADAVPALIKALHDKDNQVRELAAYALGEIGPQAQAAVRPLVVMLRDPASAVRKQAAASLRRIGPAAVPVLAGALHSKYSATREAAAHALGLLGPDAKDALDALAEAAHDKHAGTRIQAISAIGGIGPEAKKAAPALFDALKVKHVETQARAAAALLAIGAGSDKELAATMRKISREVRWAKPPVLAQFGRRPKDAVRPLILTLKDDDPNQRAAAAMALRNIGRDAKQGVPALKKALKDPDLRVRLAAAGALPCIDEGSHKEAIRAYDQFLTQLENRQIALQALIQARLALLQAQLLQRNQTALQAALVDPVLQGYFNEVVGTYVVAISSPPPGINAVALSNFQEMVGENLKNLGPAAGPALVQGVNVVAGYQIGFT